MSCSQPFHLRRPLGTFAALARHRLLDFEFLGTAVEQLLSRYLYVDLDIKVVSLFLVSSPALVLLPSRVLFSLSMLRPLFSSLPLLVFLRLSLHSFFEVPCESGVVLVKGVLLRVVAVCCPSSLLLLGCLALGKWTTVGGSAVGRRGAASLGISLELFSQPFVSDSEYAELLFGIGVRIFVRVVEMCLFVVGGLDLLESAADVETEDA